MPSKDKNGRHFLLEAVPGEPEYRWNPIAPPEADRRFRRSWTDALQDSYYARHTDIYRYALIGFGSSIAYYLDAMAQQSVSGKDAPGLAYGDIVLYGKNDAWEEQVRGEGFVNHELHDIHHWSQGVPGFSSEYRRRKDFAKDNRAVLQRALDAGAKHRPAPVKAVRRVGDVFLVEDADGKVELAAKVIIGCGAGPHYDFDHQWYVPRLPEKLSRAEKEEARAQLLGKVVHLDAFMQAHRFIPNAKPVSSGRTVVVHGANAGIDAVQRAWEHGYEVQWFMGTREDEIPFLAGNRLDVSPAETRWDGGKGPHGKAYQYVEVTRGDVVYVEPAAEDRVAVRVVDKVTKQEKRALTVDAYVIALGQNPMAPGAVGDVLLQGGFGWSDLEPIYDRDQVFGLPYQTVLGIQAKGTGPSRGLQIIGAAAQSLALAREQEAKLLAGRGSASGLEHDYGEQLGLGIEEALAGYRRGVKEGCAKNDLKVSIKSVLETVRYVEEHVKEAETYLARFGNVSDLMNHQIDPKKVPKDVKDFQAAFKAKGLSTPEQPAATAIASVLAAAQLGGVRAAAAALQGMVPDYLAEGKVNFTNEDRTMLAVYVAQNFCEIPPAIANQIVEDVVGSRRGKGVLDCTVLGYDDQQSKTLQALLAAENAAWVGTPKDDWIGAAEPRKWPKRKR